MRYLFLICGDETSWQHVSAAELADDPGPAEWNDYISKVGRWPIGARLRPTKDAVTVRVRDDELLVTDGPFAETAEQIGGFDLIECRGIEDALDIAAHHPGVSGVTIEIRPLRT